jgi:hypothetical protein
LPTGYPEQGKYYTGQETSALQMPVTNGTLPGCAHDSNRRKNIYILFLLGFAYYLPTNTTDDKKSDLSVIR